MAEPILITFEGSANDIDESQSSMKLASSCERWFLIDFLR